jgi:hypothetical protein
MRRADCRDRIPSRRRRGGDAPPEPARRSGPRGRMGRSSLRRRRARALLGGGATPRRAAARLRLPRARRMGGRAPDPDDAPPGELGFRAAIARRRSGRDARVQAPRSDGAERLVVGPARLRVPARRDDAAHPETAGRVRVGAGRRRRDPRARRDRGHDHGRKRRQGNRLARGARLRGAAAGVRVSAAGDRPCFLLP